VAQRKESIMLVLSRQINEQIHIGNDIHVTVVAIRGDKVRLGIEAPKSVPILRDEILQRIASGESLRAIEDDLDHRDNL